MPRTVFIVDDHAGFRGFARRLLEADGFTVVGEAGDADSALAAIAALRPEVVLLDVVLPDRSGFAVAEQLAAGAGRALVVLTSSLTESDLGELVHTEHAQGFIAKHDLTPAALAALLGEAI
jgi:DNA-binding NarL/FixJ family response regulator